MRGNLEPFSTRQAKCQASEWPEAVGPWPQEPPQGTMIERALQTTPGLCLLVADTLANVCAKTESELSTRYQMRTVTGHLGSDSLWQPADEEEMGSEV